MRGASAQRLRKTEGICSAKTFVAQSRVWQKNPRIPNVDPNRIPADCGIGTLATISRMHSTRFCRHNAGIPPAHPAAEPRRGWSRQPTGRRKHRHSPNAGTNPSRRLQRTRTILNHRCQCWPTTPIAFTECGQDSTSRWPLTAQERTDSTFSSANRHTVG